MNRRIIVHPGFHKTGTSSMQHFLWHNRARLLPFVEIYQLRHLRAVAQIAMGFSRSHNPMHLIDMSDVLADVFKDFGSDDSRDILLTCEGLSGHLPGWPGVDTYAAAPTLAAYLAGWLGERFAGAEIIFVYSLRDVDGWLSSTWRHHLLGQRLVLDEPEFEVKYRAAANLLGITADVEGEIDGLELRKIWLDEAKKHALGLGGTLTDMLNLPDDVCANLQPVLPGNIGPNAGLAAQMLALNRGGLADADLVAQKANLAKAAGVGGWQRPERQA